MIENYVNWISGIGKRTQQRLRREGYTSHEDYISQESTPPQSISKELYTKIQKTINLLNHSLEYNNKDWILSNIPKEYHWMLIPYFIGKIAYIDIETTGLSKQKNQITTVAVYDGESIKDFIFGQNLQDLPRYLEKYPAIATYNGKCFDVPFMKFAFKRNFEFIHFDLRYLLAKVGQKGGLKAIEHRLKINREGMKDLDGYSAVILWKLYKKTGEKRYLDTLLAYNNADVFSLEYLLAYSYNQRSKFLQLPYNNLDITMADPKDFDGPVADEPTVKEILKIRGIK